MLLYFFAINSERYLTVLYLIMLIEFNHSNWGGKNEEENKGNALGNYR